MARRLARATITFGGLRRGDVIPVETDSPYVAERIEKELLVLIDDEPESEPEEKPTPPADPVGETASGGS